MYRLIDRFQDLPINNACKCLDVSCSGYYDWRKRPLSDPEMELRSAHNMGLRLWLFPGRGATLASL